MEDFNTGVWKNPSLSQASYVPFHPIPTPTMDVEQLTTPTTSPTSTVSPTAAPQQGTQASYQPQQGSGTQSPASGSQQSASGETRRRRSDRHQG